MRTEPITEHFDEKVCCCGSLDADAALLPLTGQLLDALDHDGLAGRTVLEVGCGRGGLLVEVLRRGAAHATGIDLSPQALAATGQLAASLGVGERCTTRAGDAATAELEVHDVVVLDRVICCYPDSTGLLANTIPAARTTYAYVVPTSRGLRGRVARVERIGENTLRRLRRDPFRSFVHDVDTMDRTLAEHGFVRAARRVRGTWELRVHRRRTA